MKERVRTRMCYPHFLELYSLYLAPIRSSRIAEQPGCCLDFVRSIREVSPPYSFHRGEGERVPIEWVRYSFNNTIRREAFFFLVFLDESEVSVKGLSSSPYQPSVYGNVDALAHVDSFLEPFVVEKSMHPPFSFYIYPR